MLNDVPSLIPLGENGLLHSSYPTNSYVKCYVNVTTRAEIYTTKGGDRFH